MWNLPGQGIEPVSPALTVGFLTTGPPGKSTMGIFNKWSCQVHLQEGKLLLLLRTCMRWVASVRSYTKVGVFFCLCNLISILSVMCMVVCSNVNSVMKRFSLFCTFVISQNGLEILPLIFSQQFMFQIGCILCLFLFLMC